MRLFFVLLSQLSSFNLITDLFVRVIKKSCSTVRFQIMKLSKQNNQNCTTRWSVFLRKKILQIALNALNWNVWAKFSFFSSSPKWAEVKPQWFTKCVKPFYLNALFAALPVQHLRGELDWLITNTQKIIRLPSLR